MTAKTEGDALLEKLAALANPHRLRIVMTLQENGPVYVSQMARDFGISRPLLHLHLRKLESAGLVSSQLEFSKDGKSLNYYRVEPFDIHLTPQGISEVSPTLSPIKKSTS